MGRFDKKPKVLTDEELDRETRKRIKATPDRLIDVIKWVREQRKHVHWGIKEGWDYVKDRQNG